MSDTDPDFALGATLTHSPLPAEPAPFVAGPDVYVHASAIIEPGVVIGRGSMIWDNVHIRHDAALGESCIVGEKTYVAYGVRIGNRCKINGFVYICTAVTIEDGVMISAGTIFTNDRFPRATTPDLKALRSSDPDEHTLPTRVREGATIGAGCTVGSGLTIGRFAMVGMGALVTKSVPDFALAIGQPAVPVGAVCRCGQLLLRHAPGREPTRRRMSCEECGRQYEYRPKQIVELDETATPLPGNSQAKSHA